VAEGCKEALLLGVCSSADEQLMESLLTLHGDEGAARQDRARRIAAPAAKPAAKTLAKTPARRAAKKPTRR
jgi:hypothetical protein